MTLDLEHWQDRLTTLAHQHGVVGASFAVGLGDETATAASGVLNLRTSTPVTTDSVFQIGSITKVWTAVLAMQLVDEGLLDLDTPLISYLPEFRVADADVTQKVTVRQLLSHTSGIDGDLFLDTGRGDDNLQAYVAAMAELRQNHPLGATMSYCNSGFSLLGRLVEVLRGTTWDAALREHLVAPLGLIFAGTLPEEALLFSAATGHITPPGADEPQITPQWGLFRSAGPAGLIHARAEDLLTFARLHLSAGVTSDGTRILSEASVEAMQQPQVELPDRWTLGSHWGLGWILMEWSGRRVYGHDGATLGQNGFLRILPDAGLSVALLTNGGHSHELFTDLFGQVFRELADVELPASPEPVADPAPFDPAAYVGHYAREGVEMSIEQGEDEHGLTAMMRPVGALAVTTGGEAVHFRLQPFVDGAFVAQEVGEQEWIPAVFFSLPGGQQYLHFGARATPRVQR